VTALEIKYHLSNKNNNGVLNHRDYNKTVYYIKVLHYCLSEKLMPAGKAR